MIEHKISVVMPAYNEAHRIRDNLYETVETLRRLKFNYEIILVDDGSTDHTWLEAGSLFSNYSADVKILRYDNNEGKGSALVRGAQQATGDFVVFLDADMDLHPSQLTVFFQILLDTSADIVIGSKFHPRSRVNYPAVRKLWSAGYYTFVRLLFGLPVRDTQTGLKVFRAEVVRRVFPRMLVKRFAFDVEVLAVAHRLGYRICEAPVTLHFQRAFGRVNLREVLWIFRDTLAVFYRLKLLRYYDNVYAEWPVPEPHDQPVFGAAKE